MQVAICECGASSDSHDGKCVGLADFHYPYPKQWCRCRRFKLSVELTDLFEQRFGYNPGVFHDWLRPIMNPPRRYTLRIVTPQPKDIYL